MFAPHIPANKTTHCRDRRHLLIWGLFFGLFISGLRADDPPPAFILEEGEAATLIGNYTFSHMIIHGELILAGDTGNGTVHEQDFGNGNNGDDRYRFQLQIDFAAAEGDATGSLFYLNLSDGDTVYQPLASLQGKPLAISRMHANAQPATWNTMWLHALTRGGSNPRADNFVPNVNAVRITDVVRDGGDVILNWIGSAGPYQLERSPDLSAGGWQDFGSPTDSTTITAPLDTPRRFFRVRKL